MTARDYVPTNGWTVFSHQFSSIAGAGPVTGAIQAAAFGWVPGAAVGAHRRHLLRRGHGLRRALRLGQERRQVHGHADRKVHRKARRKLFLLFCWLFCGIVIAAFADMVAGTFNAYTVVDGVTQLAEAAQTKLARPAWSQSCSWSLPWYLALVQKKSGTSRVGRKQCSAFCSSRPPCRRHELPAHLRQVDLSYITFVTSSSRP